MTHETTEPSFDDAPSLEGIPEPRRQPSNAARVQFGRPMPPQLQVLLYSADEWEEFILEWAHCKESDYHQVRRLAGPGDMGIDVAGFVDDQGLDGIWDNYQCKHYETPLTPGIAAPEIAKILWHSYSGRYVAPRKHYFVAPKGCGTTLTALLNKPSSLKAHVFSNWDRQCAAAVTRGRAIGLEGDFREYVEAFDFSRFASRNLLEVVDEHRASPYHAIRFGGGLPARPTPAPPPALPQTEESRYIQQLYEAYGDRVQARVSDVEGLKDRQDLVDHYHRQREFFYHAEALRGFARDTVPPGTFEDLQTEVYAGVVDVAAGRHEDALERLDSVTQAATQVQLTSNSLISVVKVPDRKGICHQLANEDRLTWKPS